jgi:hypothetical protein
MKLDGPARTRKDLRDDEHDIIVFRKVGGEQRFAFDPASKEHEAPEPLPLSAPGGRKARDLGRPHTVRLADSGPALAISPTRPEPAAQNGTCIIINQENVRIRNTWTTARLNNEPNSTPDRFDKPLAGQAQAFEVLVAWPDGEVHLIRKQAGHGASPTVTPVDASTEGELWYQLRNGLVAGRVPLFNSEPRNQIVPVVNVASLQDDPDDPITTEGPCA